MTLFNDILGREFSGLTLDDCQAVQNALKERHPGPNTLFISLLYPGFPLSDFLDSEGVTIHNARSSDVSRSFGWPRDLPSTSSSLYTLDSVQGEKNDENQTEMPMFRFRYKGTNFIVYGLTWQGNSVMYIFVFDAPMDVVQQVNEHSKTSSAGHELINDVYAWKNLEECVWVFTGWKWRKDRKLWEVTQETSWSNIVLEEDLLDAFRRDVKAFFEKRDVYKALGAAWTRGILLVGPRGNGKTETVKALLKESGQVVLYVKPLVSVFSLSSAMQDCSPTNSLCSMPP